jgi:hypothetical protein
MIMSQVAVKKWTPSPQNTKPKDMIMCCLVRAEPQEQLEVYFVGVAGQFNIPIAGLVPNSPWC